MDSWALARSLISARTRITTIPTCFSVHGLGKKLGRQIEIDAARTTGDGRANGTRHTDTDVLGVVGRIPDVDTALLVLWGICCLDGLTPHTDYWLDPGVPGSLTSAKPSENGRLVLHHCLLYTSPSPRD